MTKAYDSLVRKRRILIHLCAAIALIGGCKTNRAPYAPSAPEVSGAAAPAGRMPQDARVIESNDREWRVGYITTPSPVVANEPFAIEVHVESIGGTDAGVTLAVDAAMPHHGHGMNVEPRVTRRGEGVFIVEGTDFHMPGRWELYFDITRGGRTSRAQDEITLE